MMPWMISNRPSPTAARPADLAMPRTARPAEPKTRLRKPFCSAVLLTSRGLAESGMSFRTATTSLPLTLTLICWPLPALSRFFSEGCE